MLYNMGDRIVTMDYCGVTSPLYVLQKAQVTRIHRNKMYSFVAYFAKICPTFYTQNVLLHDAPHASAAYAMVSQSADVCPNHG